jgi:hypothetical protein
MPIHSLTGDTLERYWRALERGDLPDRIPDTRKAGQRRDGTMAWEDPLDAPREDVTDGD